MRRVVVVLGIAAVLAGGAPAAVGSPSAPAVQGDCRITQLVVLFWPQGHPSLPRVGFPAFRIPHGEVFGYQGATTYVPSNQVAYTGTDRKTMLVKGCRRVKETKSFNVLPARSTRAKAAVTCGFRTPAHIQIRNVAGSGVRSELRLIEPPNKLVLLARFAPVGSSLSYSIAQCRAGGTPG